MKIAKLIIVAFLICLFPLLASAQHTPGITVSHQGKLTLYGMNSLDSAVKNALEGDTIYLSKGSFSGATDITIERPMTIMGSGYDTWISTPIRISIPEGNLTATLLTGVHAKEVSFKQSVKNALIEYCEIDNVNFDESIVVSDALFKSLTIHAMVISKGVESIAVVNSAVHGLSGPHNSDANKIVFTNSNCGIKKNENYTSNLVALYNNCIIYSSYYDCYQNANSLFRNCLISTISGGWGIGINDQLRCIDCKFFAQDSNKSISDILTQWTPETLQEGGYIGTDGTVIGVYGGTQYKYSVSPQYPVLESDKTSIEYDDASKNVKVSISVKNPD